MSNDSARSMRTRSPCPRHGPRQRGCGFLQARSPHAGSSCELPTPTTRDASDRLLPLYTLTTSTHASIGSRFVIEGLRLRAAHFCTPGKWSVSRHSNSLRRVSIDFICTVRRFLPRGESMSPCLWHPCRAPGSDEHRFRVRKSSSVAPRPLLSHSPWRERAIRDPRCLPSVSDLVLFSSAVSDPELQRDLPRNRGFAAAIRFQRHFAFKRPRPASTLPPLDTRSAWSLDPARTSRSLG